MKIYAAIKMKKNLLDYFRATSVKEDLCSIDTDMKDVFNFTDNA